MLILIIKRIGFMIITMIAVSLLVFGLLEINIQSVAVKVLGPYTSEQQRHLWLLNHGYLRPFYVRYFSWLFDFFTGHWGESVRFKVPVSEVLWPRLANTGILVGCVFALMVPISLVLGVLSGMREGSKLDRDHFAGQHYHHLGAGIRQHRILRGNFRVCAALAAGHKSAWSTVSTGISWCCRCWCW